MTTTNEAATATDSQLITQRVLNAPRELVFEVFTDPKHLEHWWGPNGFSTKVHVMDVTAGGDWILTMHGPDHTGVVRDFPNKLRYLEVVKPEKLVYQHTGEKGFEFATFRTTVTFEEVDGNKTNLTMTMDFDSAEERNRIADTYGAKEGAQQTFNKLGQYLSTITSN